VHQSDIGDEFMLTILMVLLLATRFGIATDEGSGIDPHGGVHDSAQCTDEGNGLDPHGAPCTRAFNADDGRGIDPNG
jgi:hypothetical protein